MVYIMKFKDEKKKDKSQGEYLKRFDFKNGFNIVRGEDGKPKIIENRE